MLGPAFALVVLVEDAVGQVDAVGNGRHGDIGFFFEEESVELLVVDGGE